MSSDSLESIDLTTVEKKNMNSVESPKEIMNSVESPKEIMENRKEIMNSVESSKESRKESPKESPKEIIEKNTQKTILKILTSGKENSDDQKEEKLFILTESLDDGVRDVLPIYSRSDIDVARYLMENANVVSMFEDRDYNNLFTYILEFIELSVGQEFADEETQDVLDNLPDYLSPQDILDIIDHSKVDGKTQAGYSLYEIPLPNIGVSYPDYIKF